MSTLTRAAGGLAHRLALGVQSLHERRDGHVRIHLASSQGYPGKIRLTIWSDGARWSGCSWWIHTTLLVHLEEYGQVRLEPDGTTTMAVRDTDGTTTFQDRAGVLGHQAAARYLAWAGRGDVRWQVGATEGYGPEVQALRLEEFLTATPAT